MNDRYFACPTHRRHVDAGYRWARHELEEAGVVTLGQPVDVEAVMQRAAYWDVPDDEHAPWLEATLDGVRGFLDEHGGHELIYVESEFLDEQSLLGYEWREAAVTAWPAPPPE